VHELGVAQTIIELVAERCDAGKRITRVVVEVGKLTAILPDALRFGFDVASEGTPAEGASLELIETAGQELRVREMEVV
jgi:hydrogenase nickel incorporation protein HypA/HybF